MPPGDGERAPRARKAGPRQTEVQPLREEGRGHWREPRSPADASSSQGKGAGTVGGGAVRRDGAPRAAEGAALQAGTGRPPARAPAFPRRSVCACGIRVPAGSEAPQEAGRPRWQGSALRAHGHVGRCFPAAGAGGPRRQPRPDTCLSPPSRKGILVYLLPA